MLECSEIRQFEKCAVRFRFTQVDFGDEIGIDARAIYFFPAK
ncbi:hypothetical protein VT98_10383 [Candidatus Electrothrix communis]|uniref:Uncharacterized protein n=1 Tax=Candidatus Electrothrix communis TaxID=1859133 RepID=A0A444J8U8_9BACT|nr:hypothetical protein VT98_10383 [Candidatus Electrothrix communis]